MKNKKTWAIVGLVAFVVCLSLALVLFVFNQRGPEPTDPQTNGDPVEHSICVKNDKGEPLADIAVYVYTDSERAELAWFNKTDADGKMTFTDIPRDSYVAVLENVPTGYGVEEYYALTGVETEIILSVGQMSDEDMQTLTYHLGDLVMDFSVTAADGNVYTLSELLKEKKAVILNFWYLDCQPCLQEFPFLQEAYGEYSDRIEVLAMNPIDKLEDIAAFQKENGYTFPMAAVDQAWINMMKLTAFPTTVCIDRYGNIMLIHTGSIDKAQTFKDVFNYFCADEYEQDIIKSISDIESEQEEGSEENPEELGGVASFEVKVAPGKVYYTELYKVTDMYLTIYSKDAYVLYNNKTYEPSNGVISVLLKCPDMNTPVNVGIGNKSDEEKTFKVYLVPKAGTINNPYPLSLGEFTAKVGAGNEVGVYYLFTAAEDGLLKMECLNAPAGVKYSYYLYNLNTYAMRNLEEDGESSEDGKRFVSVTVKKGQQVQFSIGTLPDETNSYPGGTFQMLASFDNGVKVEDARPFNEKIAYTVTLKDQNGKAVSDASIHFSGTVTAQEATEKEEAVTENVDQYILTDSSGKATLSHYPGTLEAKVRVPDGYTLENTAYTLTKDAPSVTVTLHKIEYKDYTVKVLAPTGDPVQGVIVVFNGKVAYTGEQGTAVFNMPAGTYTALVLGIPGEYILADNSYEVTADVPEVTANLSYAPGHETNPIEIRDQAKFKVEALEAGATRYYSVYGVGGTTLEMEMTNGYILINGTKYEPQEIAGAEDEEPISKITVALEEGTAPVSIAVVNTDTKAQNFTVEFAFPEGTRYNPVQIKSRGSTAVISETVESYFLYYKPASNVTDGTLTISLTKIVGGTDFDIVVTNGDQTAKLSESSDENKIVFEFVGNKQILIQFVATKPLTNEISVTVKPSVSPSTGATYTVTLVDTEGNPLPGVQLQFMQGNEAVGGIFTTDGSGVVKTALPKGGYTVVLVDGSYEYDKSEAVVSSSKTSVTITATRTEEPVGEGMTRYNVMVSDYLGNVVGDYLVLFMKDGEPVAYNIVGTAGGITTMELETGSYEVQLAFLGQTEYYYEQSAAVLTEQTPDLTVKVAAASKTTPEEHWQLGQITPISLGGVYVKPQKDVNTYFSFTPTQQGVYRITVSNPNAVLSYWGSPNYPMDTTNQLEDFEGTTFTVSVNTNALGQTHVVGVKGTEGCILSVLREGDAKEDVPYTPYTAKTTPVAQSLPAGLSFTYVDIKKPTGTYNLVYNSTDGYYHLGSANGPVMYVQLDYTANGSAAPYITLYEMVGGVSNTGTALRCVYTDGEGNEIREDYTDCMLSYGACADQTYGVYPVTEDLIYMIQMGGQHLGWWDANNANSQMLFASGENLEIAWMFAFCYVA